MARASKNDPNSRNKTDVVKRKCEFCGSEKGVHQIQISGAGRKRRITWGCNEDKCPRFN